MRSYLLIFLYGGPFNRISTGDVRLPDTNESKRIVKTAGKILLSPLLLFLSCSGDNCLVNEPENPKDKTPKDEITPTESTVNNREPHPVNRDTIYSYLGTDDLARETIRSFKESGYFDNLKTDSIGGPVLRCSDKGAHCGGQSKPAINYIVPAKKGKIMSAEDWRKVMAKETKTPGYLQVFNATEHVGPDGFSVADSIYPVYYSPNIDSADVFIRLVDRPSFDYPSQYYLLGDHYYTRGIK